MSDYPKIHEYSLSDAPTLIEFDPLFSAEFHKEAVELIYEVDYVDHYIELTDEALELIVEHRRRVRGESS